MIFGPQDAVEAVVLTPEMGPDDFRAKLLDAIDKFENKEQILFLADLWGGTPFNQISKLIEERGGEDWVCVTGMNLPMVIEAYGDRFGMETAKEIAQAIKPEAKNGVRIKPESCEVEDAAAPAAAAPANAPVGAIPEGTVLGDGKIDIAFARIDTRLLHGQVATTVTKMVNPDRIIVCSDDVAKEVTEKVNALKEALKGEDIEAVKTAQSELMTSAQKIGQVLYAQQGAEGAAGAAGAGAAGAAGASAGSDDDVVDAEVVDDDDKDNK